MEIDQREKTVLRDLAKRVAEIAAEPVMQQRREMWLAHNSLRLKKPLILVYPEGAWEELLPDEVLECRTNGVRRIEQELRQRIYTFEHFHTDTVIEAEWVQPAAIGNTGWGLEPQRHDAPDERGAWGFDPVLQTPADLKRMHHPDLVYDEQATARNMDAVNDLFGDILRVRPKGYGRPSFHIAKQYTSLRGLSEAMMDMAAQPDFVHQVVSFLADGNQRLLDQIVEANLLSLNNDNTYVGTGGNGYTDELPADGFDAERVRLCDMWANAESQETAQVSPDMHDEFFFRYERRLLEPFGLTCYGCCEDLTRKLDALMRLPNLRRISVAPWADVDACAAKLKGDYIFSWKPNPAHLVGRFDADALRRYIEHTVRVARDNGCVLETVLKDTHTCEHHPERFDQWTRIARDVVEQAA